MTVQSQAVALADEKPRLSENPMAVYLGRLHTQASRDTQSTALETIAALLLKTKESSKKERVVAALAFRWWELRYQHVALVQTVLLGKGMAPATVNRHMTALRRVLQECWRLDLMTSDDYAKAKDVKDIKNHRLPAGRMIEPDEVGRMFSENSVRDAAILAVMFAGGLRRAEIARLDLADIKKDHMVVNGKGNKQRMVPLDDAMVEIRKWVTERGSEPGPLFLNQSKERLTPQGIRYIVNAIAGRVGVEDISPHDARRTFASNAIDESKDVFSVQTLLGHASPQTTARYDRRGEAAQRKVISAIKIPRPPHPNGEK